MEACKSPHHKTRAVKAVRLDQVKFRDFEDKKVPTAEAGALWPHGRI